MNRPADRYERLVFDLDGTLWRGSDPLPTVAETLGELRRLGKRLAFCTNSPHRSAVEVAAALRAIGVEASGGEVVTSGRAACRHLAGEGVDGARAFVIGGAGLRADLAPLGFEFLRTDDGHKAEVVVVGRDGDCTYAMLRAAFRAIIDGARFVATNRDRTHPVADGLEPGGGALVAAVEYATEVTPVVVGKPELPMLQAAAEIIAPDGPTLLVGDKPEADLVGAQRMGWDGGLVLTGVTHDADGVQPAPHVVLPVLAALLG